MNPSIAVARPSQNLMQDIAPPRPAPMSHSEVFAPRQAPAAQPRDNFVMSNPIPAPSTVANPVSANSNPMTQPNIAAPAAAQPVEHKAPAEHHKTKSSTPVLAIIFALLIAVGLMVVAYLAFKNSATLSANL